ncbi:MAG: mechanosensitive ion channel family protein [Desulfuromonadales bacterium]|nr:mechanosensitive ion channel family protein [Desulfuromonadales bacterium]
MDIVQTYLDSLNWKVLINTGMRILLVLLFAWIIMVLVKRLLLHMEQHLIRKSQVEGEPPSESAKRVETLTRLIRQAVYLLLVVTVVLVVLKEIGVDIAPILAGAGILGLAVGFGGQNLVRDVISGFFFILENQVRVGDVAIINGTGGLVEAVNFRTIVLRDLSATVHVFPNGTINTLSNMTHTWSAYVFDIGVAYKEDTDRVVELLKEVGRQMRDDPQFGPHITEDLEIFGVNKFADSAVEIKGRIKTKPIQQWSTGREFLRRVKHSFDENNIEIPFPHLSLYRGEASPAFELELMRKSREE